jgi:hypothetical protein
MQDPATEFRQHADECRRMARYSNLPEDKAGWEHLAERWQRCAELAQEQAAAAQVARKTKNRKPDPFSMRKRAA